MYKQKKKTEMTTEKTSIEDRNMKFSSDLGQHGDEEQYQEQNGNALLTVMTDSLANKEIGKNNFVISYRF